MSSAFATVLGERYRPPVAAARAVEDSLPGTCGARDLDLVASQPRHDLHCRHDDLEASVELPCELVGMHDRRVVEPGTEARDRAVLDQPERLDGAASMEPLGGLIEPPGSERDPGGWMGWLRER